MAAAQTVSDGEGIIIHSAASFQATMLYGDLESRLLQESPLGPPRSAPLAFGLSALVPGAGQAYNRQWLKAGIMVAAEVALVTSYVVSKNRGDDGTTAYQSFAEKFWSPLRYASWLNDYTEHLEGQAGGTIADPIVISTLVQGVDFTQSDSWSQAERSAVRDLFDQIRAVEGQVYHPNGASFSHKLPYFAEQQYYELVGKYDQFAPGWDDYGYWQGGEEAYDQYIHPDHDELSARFVSYADDHGQANDYLRQASRISVLILANHFISAVDAAVFSKIHNDRVKASLQVHVDDDGNAQPMASVQVRF